MKKETLYVAPMVDVIEVEVEKGFAESTPKGSTGEDLEFGGGI